MSSVWLPNGPANAFAQYAFTTPNLAGLRLLNPSQYPYVYVEGHTTPGDGGGGWYYVNNSDTTSADNNGNIIISGVITTARYYLDNLGGPINVKNFGAKGDNVTDDYAACQAAYNAAVALNTGAEVYWPRGYYLLSQEIIINTIAYTKGIRTTGEGRGITTIRPTVATNNVFFQQQVDGMTYEGFTVFPTVTQTAGAAIQSNISQRTTVRDIELVNCFTGFILNADADFFVDNVDMTGIASDGFEVTGASFGSVDHCTMKGAAGNTGCGFKIISTGGIFLTNTDCTEFTNGIALIPQVTGDSCNWMSVSNSDFDTCTYACLIAPLPASTNGVMGCQFSNCWFSTSVNNGIFMSGTGVISGVKFNDCRIFNNSKDGIVIANGWAEFDACQISGNGISAAGTYSGYKLTNTANLPNRLKNCFIGQLGTLQNTQNGINVSGNCSGFEITDNKLGTNVTNNVSAGVWTNFKWSGNIGAPVGAVNPPAAITVGASPFTYTNSFQQNQSVQVNAGTISQIVLVRNAVATGTGVIAGVFTLSPGDALKITYTVAPAMGQYLLDS